MEAKIPNLSNALTRFIGNKENIFLLQVSVNDHGVECVHSSQCTTRFDAPLQAFSVCIDRSSAVNHLLENTSLDSATIHELLDQEEGSAGNKQ